MGGDGGCVPQRADMVKTVGYGFAYDGGGQGFLANTIIQVGTDQVGAKEARRIWMSTCRLSSEPLKEPIVCDRLGSLMNKEAVLTTLMTKKHLIQERFPHISKLKDVRDCKCLFSDQTQGAAASSALGLSDRDTLGAAASGSNKKAAIVGGSVGRPLEGGVDGRHILCPLTGAELDDGVTRAVLLWNCGCLMAKKSLDSLTKADKIGGSCPSCGMEGSLGELLEGRNNAKMPTRQHVCSNCEQLQRS